MFDDDATEFDPNPWGARQRVMPRETFIVAPSPAAVAAPALFAPAPITLRLPVFPTLPLHHRRLLARLAIPLCGLAALLCLAVAYALKPASQVDADVAALAIPVVEPAEMHVEATATDAHAPAPVATKAAMAVEAAVAAAKPVVAKPVVAKLAASPVVGKPVVAKPRAKAKRRAVVIDASITSTPLGHLRPSRR